ncbi:MAG: beta-hexosaminidase, partial [Pseudomonadota bacterium]
NCWAKMDDMHGIAKALPPLPPKGHERLERALAVAARKTGADQAELLAKRDALLGLVSAA